MSVRSSREQRIQSKERQRRRNITGLAVGLVIAVVLSLFSGMQWRNAEQERHHAVEQKAIAERKTAEAELQTLAANYNLAKAFEEKALSTLSKANEEGHTYLYKKVVLFSSAAIEQHVKRDQIILSPSSFAALFDTGIFNNALAEEWVILDEEERSSNLVSSFQSDDPLILDEPVFLS